MCLYCTADLTTHMHLQDLLELREGFLAYLQFSTAEFNAEHTVRQQQARPC